MASKLAEAYIEISTKTAGLDSGLAASESKLAGFAGRAGGLLAGLAAGLAGGGAANFIREMADAGGDLIETMNKVNVVFGDSSGIIFRMADDMATNLGSVKGTTLDAAAGIGLIGQAAGMSAGESARLAQSMVRLGDDASSFFNVPLDVALGKIRSGLVGEAEPLRQFGVLLSEGAVKAQALAMGFTPVNGLFTEQEKVLARVEIITRSLAKAQGDHAKTMDSYANAVKRLTGDWENFKAESGVSIAGGMALNMAAVRKGGILGFLDKALGSIFGPNQFQAEADKQMGVKTGLTGLTRGPNQVQQTALSDVGIWAKRMAQIRADNERLGLLDPGGKAFRANQFFGGGFGAFGMMGNLGQEINRQAMVGDLDSRIAEQKARMSEWSGGHVTDPLSFLKSAQEKILERPDPTAQKQLDELIKIREALSKGGPNKPVGAIAKGPEH